MDGDGIGQFQLLQLLEAILYHLALIEFNGEQFRKIIDLPDDSNVAVKDSCSLVHRYAVLVADLPLHLVVVLYLHDFITYPVNGSA